MWNLVYSAHARWSRWPLAAGQRLQDHGVRPVSLGQVGGSRAHLHHPPDREVDTDQGPDHQIGQPRPLRPEPRMIRGPAHQTATVDSASRWAFDITRRTSFTETVPSLKAAKRRGCEPVPARCLQGRRRGRPDVGQK